MATTDVARVSHDWARRYTGVAPQQGRVTLEAEENEERVILAAERRLELLDLIGPAATPDDGYAISAGTAAGDFTIGAGTMYVGGLRVELEQDVDYFNQPDWLDSDTDPDYATVVNASPGADQHVVLVLVDADVSATEDPVLREVALGGPDGASRTRLLQRIVALPGSAGDCGSALQSDIQWWLSEGLDFDPATARLRSLTRLKVGFDEQPGNDLCQPSAKGGYLGADNQAIRVHITAMNPDGTFDLLWGWDNASFLYRVSADASTNPILTLDRSPVDDYHCPRTGQAVQVLRATAELQSTDDFVEGYMAALSGTVGVLTAPYDPDTKTLQFPSPLPTQYTDQRQTRQLFLRVWEGQITSQKLGTPVSLPGTGLNVTLTAAHGSVLHDGDFWTIGVRPETPQNVLPARLLRVPQPPDGPRMWACPLAVIGWQDGAFELLDDCRVPFPECEGGCCTVTARQTQATQLQALIDKAALRRRPMDRAHRITVCLKPGRYELERPLRFGHGHSHLVLEGCHDGVVIAAKAGAEEAFGQGLIELVHADNVTITGIEFELPQTSARGAKVVAQMAELAAFKTPLQTIYRDLYMSIGLRPVHCAVLEVDRCLFRFTIDATDARLNSVRNVFGVGIYAGSECWGMRVEGCRFLHDAENIHQQPVQLPGTSPASAGTSTGSGSSATLAKEELQIQQRIARERRQAASQSQPEHVLAGILLSPGLLYRGGAHLAGGQIPKAPAASAPAAGASGTQAPAAGASGTQAPAAGVSGTHQVVVPPTHLVVLPSGALLRALITRGRIKDNEFSGLTVGIYLVAQIGELRIEDNSIRACYGGVWLGSSKAQAYADVAGNYTAVADVQPQVLERAGIAGTSSAAAAADEQMMKLSVISRTYPMPDAFSPSGKDRMIAAHVTQEAHKASQLQWQREFVLRATAPFQQEAQRLVQIEVDPSSSAPGPGPAVAPAQSPAQSPAPGPAPTPAPPADTVLTRLGTSGAAAEAKVDQNLQHVHTLLSQYELGAAFAGESRWFELRLAGNDIECAAPFRQPAGPALRIWESEQPTGSALINDNRLVTSGYRAAMVLGVPIVLCNANLIVAGEGGGALSVLASEQISAMANVGNGMHTPPRPQPAPVDTWPPLNTIA